MQKLILALLISSTAVAQEVNFFIPGITNELKHWSYERSNVIRDGRADRQARLRLVFEYSDMPGEPMLITQEFIVKGLRWSQDFRTVSYQDTLCAIKRWYGMQKTGCSLKWKLTDEGFFGVFSEE